MDMLRKLLSGYTLILLLAATSFAFWRYWPVSLKVTYLERVDARIDSFDKVRCRSFHLTPAKFEQHFALTQRLFAMEVGDYGVGACYYRTIVDGIEYRLWVNGVAEVRDGQDVRFYTARSLIDL